MASLVKCVIIRTDVHIENDFADAPTAKSLQSQKSIEGFLFRNERWSRTIESFRVQETQEAEQYQFFGLSVSFLVKSLYVIFSILILHSPVMLRFKTLMFLSL